MRLYKVRNSIIKGPMSTAQVDSLAVTLRKSVR